MSIVFQKHFKISLTINFWMALYNCNDWVKGLTDSEGINQLIHMQNVCCGGQHHSPFAAWLIKVDWETKVAVLRAREDGVIVQIQIKATDVIWINEYGQISSKKQQTDFQPFLHLLWVVQSRFTQFSQPLGRSCSVPLGEVSTTRYTTLWLLELIWHWWVSVLDVLPSDKWDTCHGFPGCSVSVLWHVLLRMCHFKWIFCFEIAAYQHPAMPFNKSTLY